MGKKKSANQASSTSQENQVLDPFLGAEFLGDLPPDVSSAVDKVLPQKPARKFQLFDRLVLKRSNLSFPENNPRIIDPAAFKKLRDFIKRDGLLNSLVINRRLAANGWPTSQNGRLVIVGGNQRAKAMDDISGFPGAPNSDYEVPADVIAVSPAKEAEIIVKLNNAALAGGWDHEQLSELITTTPGLDPLSTGFDRTELAGFIDIGILEQIMGAGAANQVNAEAPILDQFAAISESGREADAAARAANKTTVQTIVSVPGPNGAQSPSALAAAAAAQQAAIDGMKARRKDYQQRVNADTNTANFMLVLVADTENDKLNLLAQAGLPADTEFTPLADFLERIGFVPETVE